MLTCGTAGSSAVAWRRLAGISNGSERSTPATGQSARTRSRARRSHAVGECCGVVRAAALRSARHRLVRLLGSTCDRAQPRPAALTHKYPCHLADHGLNAGRRLGERPCVGLVGKERQPPRGVDEVPRRSLSRSRVVSMPRTMPRGSALSLSGDDLGGPLVGDDDRFPGRHGPESLPRGTPNADPVLRTDGKRGHDWFLNDTGPSYPAMIEPHKVRRLCLLSGSRRNGGGYRMHIVLDM